MDFSKATEITNHTEMVPEIVPHIEGNEIPEFGKDNLWFSKSIDIKLVI